MKQEKNDHDELYDELISEEEDEEIKARYGLENGYDGYDPHLSDYEKGLIEEGKETYEDYKRSRYATRYGFYAEDKGRLKVKRRFKADLEEAFGSLDNLSALSESVDDIYSSLNYPEMLDKKDELKRLTKSTSEEEFEELADEIVEDDSVDDPTAYLFEE